MDVVEVPTNLPVIRKDLQDAVYKTKAEKLKAIVDAVGEEGLLMPERPALGGEDFSFFCEKVPSAYFWLGCHDPAKPQYPIHHGSFAPAEEALPIGMEVLVGAALKFLAQ